jgi:quinol monooxygenase YgiN
VSRFVEAARASAGHLDFAPTADTTDPARINVHERWESDGS